MSDKIVILESADRESSLGFVASITNSSCSICSFSNEELECWDSGGQNERKIILMDFITTINDRNDRSAMFHDAEQRLVSLGRRSVEGWEILPFEKGQRPLFESIISRMK